VMVGLKQTKLNVRFADWPSAHPYSQNGRDRPVTSI
jgi:hypothetical protein